ncbi:MAG: hypothetical protein ACPGJS_14170 [Flammeovirgaceae bacterium]
MKQTQLLLIFVVLVLFSSQTLAQKSVVIHHYFLELDSVYRLDVRNLEEKIDDAANEFEGIDRNALIYIDTMYSTAVQELTTQLGYQITAKETLRDKIAFSGYNYPMVSAKRAAKSLDAPHYLRFRINLGQTLSSSESNTDAGIFAAQKRNFKPRIAIRAVLYNAKGKKIKDARGVAKSDERITLKAGALGGIINIGEKVSLDDNGAVIMETYQKALEALINNLK